MCLDVEAEHNVASDNGEARYRDGSKEVPTSGADEHIHLHLILDFTLAMLWVIPKGSKALCTKCGWAGDEEGYQPEHNAADYGNLGTKYPAYPWMCLREDNANTAVKCN